MTEFEFALLGCLAADGTLALAEASAVELTLAKPDTISRSG